MYSFATCLRIVFQTLTLTFFWGKKFRIFQVFPNIFFVILSWNLLYTIFLSRIYLSCSISSCCLSLVLFCCMFSYMMVTTFDFPFWDVLGSPHTFGHRTCIQMHIVKKNIWCLNQHLIVNPRLISFEVQENYVWGERLNYSNLKLETQLNAINKTRKMG